ncbi:hypothetical protein Rsub_10892 [Raphidocelis subcapitata]|uniref:Uncharacterized protein n=1 Tax=Raphidocelis subcapitata TaxID=307507 RepID=A0A2V0PCZ8_9CHLO|nr:hypothetical protein Rsub_10892 [Raphidocelis subcapitata]|eukprot:GBF97728.1 hypothetical protein Rsub_10892 [Raphidocelis subcapitata]
MDSPSAGRRHRHPGGRPRSWIGGGGLDPGYVAALKVPELRQLFQSVFGVATNSHNSVWLRRKLTEPPGAARGCRRRPSASDASESSSATETRNPGLWPAEHTASEAADSAAGNAAAAAAFLYGGGQTAGAAAHGGALLLPPLELLMQADAWGGEASALLSPQESSATPGASSATATMGQLPWEAPAPFLAGSGFAAGCGAAAGAFALLDDFFGNDDDDACSLGSLLDDL